MIFETTKKHRNRNALNSTHSISHAKTKASKVLISAQSWDWDEGGDGRSERLRVFQDPDPRDVRGSTGNKGVFALRLGWAKVFLSA